MKYVETANTVRVSFDHKGRLQVVVDGYTLFIVGKCKTIEIEDTQSIRVHSDFK